MLYKAIGIWLAIQIPLGVFVGLLLRTGKRPDWVEEDAEPDAAVVAVPAQMAVERSAG